MIVGEDNSQTDRVLVMVTEDLCEEIIKPPMTSLLQGHVIEVGLHSLAYARLNSISDEMFVPSGGE